MVYWYWTGDISNQASSQEDKQDARKDRKEYL
jgi:hypothetical protein